MKAKKWVVLFAAFLFLSVSAIVIVTLTKPEAGDNEITTPSQKEVVSINEEVLAALFAEADSILNTQSTITLNNNKYVQYYMRCNSMEAPDTPDTEDVISLNVADHARDHLQYLIFLSLIISRYDGYYVEIDTSGMGMSIHNYLVLCTGYKEAGYNSIQEYLDAVRSGEISTPSNAYKINFNDKSIRRCGGSPELYPELSGTGTK